MDIIEQKELMEEVDSLATIFQLQLVDTKHSKLLRELLDDCSGKLERLRELTLETYKQGITSVLTEELPGLVVLDEQRFNEFVAGKLEKLEDAILSASGKGRGPGACSKLTGLKCIICFQNNFVLS